MRASVNAARALYLPLVCTFALVGVAPLPCSAARAGGGQAAPHRAASQDGRPRFALLIGINDYLSKDVPALRGSLNDVARMKELLTSRFAFPDDAEHVRVLAGRDATRENILRQLDDFLIRNAEKHRRQNPVIVFHYSGHGSRVEDFDGDEPDGKDETIVPFDSGVGGKSDITDDELAERVGRLAELTDSALYIFDSCHSGTINRGELPAREAPEDKARYPRAESRRGSGPAVRRAEDDDAGFLASGSRYVVISAARSSQKAYEKPLPEDQYQGALTFYLSNELQRASPETSYLELMTRVSSAVRRENENQAPQAQGDLTRAVLGGAAGRADYFIRIGRVEENRRFVIEAGASSGVRRGALIAVYRSGTPRLAGREGRVALAEVKSVGSVTAVAEITELTPGAHVGVNDRAVLLTPFHGFEPMSVAVEVDGDVAAGEGERQTLASVSSLLRDEALVKVTPVAAGDGACRKAGATGRATRPAADVFVRRGTFGCAFPSPPLSRRRAADGSEILLPAAEERIFYLAARGGEPVYEFWVRAGHPQAAQAIAEALLKIARQRNLLAIENRTSPLNAVIEVTVLRVRARTNQAGETEVESETPVPLNNAGGGIYYSFKIGDLYRLQLRNKSAAGADLYVTALNVSNDGAINMMYPPAAGEVEPLKPARAVKTDIFRITPPLGEENFKIIVTTKPADFGLLIQGRIVASRDGGADSLGVLMRRALTGQSGARDVSAQGIDEWGTASLTFVIREK